MQLIQTAPFPGVQPTFSRRPKGGFLAAMLRKLLAVDGAYRERRHLSGLPDHILDDIGLNRDGISLRPADRAALRW